ncbi:hypothetical protein BURMUCF2_2874 [Burkholderia multivorans CF2]|nr:hypothetical protein BURMUCF2_2874 [Burkholderia multivorans CF2]
MGRAAGSAARGIRNGCTEYRTGALAHAPAAHGATLWFPGGAPAHASAEYDIKRDDP